MWVEVFNIEKCRSVDEPAENSTVIRERPEKGAGTHRQASENLRLWLRSLLHGDKPGVTNIWG